MKTQFWKFAVIPVVAIAFLALYPQLSIFMAKGGWNGSYFVSNYDETAYSAYVNALADGKPRKFDPFVSKEVSFESLYSIQFVPAYTVAAPQRLFGLSTSVTFILLILAIGISSALAIFFLIRDISGDDLLAASGSLVVLCFGTAAAYQGELRFLIEGRMLVEYLPFLRRYQPGLAFPLFFVFVFTIWRALNTTSRKRIVVYSAAAGIIFVALVFSYFYIWTAAAAWLACIGVFRLILNREARLDVSIIGAVVGLFAIASLLIYFSMLSDRSPNIDHTQLLNLTRTPDLVSPTMGIGIVVAISIAIMLWKGLVRLNEPATQFALSFALTPVILFNQQVVTGRSLQPAHYEIFIANYLVLISAVLALWMWLRSRSSGENSHAFRKGLVYLALIAVGWGTLEAVGASGRSSAAAVVRDESYPALEYIQQRSMAEHLAEPAVVHATNFVISDLVSTVTSQRSLWNAHIDSAGSVNSGDNKRLFYEYLYYSGFTEKDLGEMLSKNSFEITAAAFGSNRALPELAQGAGRVSAEEIRSEVRRYGDFIRSFSSSDAKDPELSWLIVPVRSEQDLSNIDRWYERSDEQEFGMFKVYRLKLK